MLATSVPFAEQGLPFASTKSKYLGWDKVEFPPINRQDLDPTYAYSKGPYLISYNNSRNGWQGTFKKDKTRYGLGIHDHIHAAMDECDLHKNGKLTYEPKPLFPPRKKGKGQ